MAVNSMRHGFLCNNNVIMILKFESKSSHNKVPFFNPLNFDGFPHTGGSGWGVWIGGGVWYSLFIKNLAYYSFH